MIACSCLACNKLLVNECNRAERVPQSLRKTSLSASDRKLFTTVAERSQLYCARCLEFVTLPRLFSLQALDNFACHS